MTEAEARERAERIVDEMKRIYGMNWMHNCITGECVERRDWLDKIAAALVEAGKET